MDSSVVCIARGARGEKAQLEEAKGGVINPGTLSLNDQHSRVAIPEGLAGRLVYDILLAGFEHAAGSGGLFEAVLADDWWFRQGFWIKSARQCISAALAARVLRLLLWWVSWTDRGGSRSGLMLCGGTRVRFSGSEIAGHSMTMNGMNCRKMPGGSQRSTERPRYTATATAKVEGMKSREEVGGGSGAPAASVFTMSL